MARRYKLFLSSPGDVATERGIVEEAVRRINDIHGADGFDLYRWEDEHYTAAATFQDQIPHASESDLVICIFWKRLGSELPEAFARPDGSIPTGSEYEFEQAIAEATSSPDQLPDIYVYRSEEEVMFSAKSLELEKLQFDKLEAFWKRWFRNERGHFTAAFDTYSDDADFADKIERALADWLARRQGGTVWTDGSPFRGLEPFEAHHAPIFFGRRRETARARARLMVLALAGQRFTLISGPSGSGKSSLARAGVIPALASPGAGDVLPDQRVQIVTSPNQLWPDQTETAGWVDAFAQTMFAPDELQVALVAGDYKTPSDLADLLTAGGPATRAPIVAALDRIGAAMVPRRPVGLVILIDQLEEIFSWPKADADAFCTLLSALSSAAPGTSGVTVLSTMRSEFRHRIPDIPTLAALVRYNAIPGPDDPDPILDITLPAPADIREMIEGPAKAAGLDFAPTKGDLSALNTRIEAEATPATLPALQFLLTQLYALRDGNMLTHAAFDELGGVAGVMGHQGEEIVKEKGAKHLPNLARALVRGGTPPTARRIAKDAIGSDPEIIAYTNAFVDAGLIVSDGKSLRLAHESLITGWDRLRDIIAKESRLFDSRDRLGALTPRYVSGKIAALEGFLLSEAKDLSASWGPDLVAEAHPKLPEFIAASVKAETRKRRLRIGSIVGGALAAVGLAVGFGLWQADQRARTATLLQASERQLAVAQSEKATRDGDRSFALSEAIRAYDLSPDAATLSLMMEKSLLLASPEVMWTRTGDFTAMAWTAENELIAATDDGAIVTLDADGMRVIARIGDSGKNQAPIILLSSLKDGAVALVTRDNRAGVVPADRFGTFENQPNWFETSPAVVLDRIDVAAGDYLSGFAIVTLGNEGRDKHIVSCDSVSLMDCEETTVRTQTSPSPGGSIVADDSIYVATDQGIRVFKSGNDGQLVAETDHPVSSISISRAGFLENILANETHFMKVVSDLYYSSDRSQHYFIFRKVSGEEVASINVLSEMVPEQVTDFGSVSLSNLPDNLVGFAASKSLFATQALIGRDLNSRPNLYLHSGGYVRQSAFSPDGRLLALQHLDGSISVIAVASLQNSPLAITRIVTGTHSATAFAARNEDSFVVSGWQLYDGGVLVDYIDGPMEHIALHKSGRSAGTIFEFSTGITWTTDLDKNKPSIDVTQDDYRLAAQRLSFTESGVLVLSRPDTLLADGHELTAEEGRSMGGIVSDPLTPDAVYFSDSAGRLQRWVVTEDTATLVVPEAVSADRTAGLSLAVDPSGRWLTSTRSDDQIRVYDLTGVLPTVPLPIDSHDSKVVDFSPDGRHVAALSSAGIMYVWSFDVNTGDFARLFAVNPSPLPVPYKDNSVRTAVWIDWMGNDHIGVATANGNVLKLSLDPTRWRARAEQILPRPAIDLGDGN